MLSIFSTEEPASDTDASSRKSSSGWRYLPHTADEILEAWGASKEECISVLATGFVAGFARVRPGAAHPESQPFAIELGKDAGMDETLAAFLEEILFVIETEAQVPVRTQVVSVKPGSLEGTFFVLPLEEIEETGAVPKAISYENFIFEERDGLWTARVTVDV